jgi:hypothetical protein
MRARVSGLLRSLLRINLLAAVIVPSSVSAELLYYTSGSSIKTWDPSTQAQGHIATYTTRLGALVFDLSGALYIQDIHGSSSIARLAPDGSFSTIETDSSVRSLAVYGETFYGVRPNSQVLSRLNEFGNWENLVGFPEYLSGLACDEKGNIFVSGQTKVFKVHPSGSFSEFADVSSYTTHSAITAITLSKSGALYVSAINTLSQGWGWGMIYYVDQTGGWHTAGSVPGGMYGPRQVAVSSTEEVVVLHSFSAFATGSQLSEVYSDVTWGYAGFDIGGIAFRSAAVPEPATCTHAGVCVAVALMAASFCQFRHRASVIGFEPFKLMRV